MHSALHFAIGLWLGIVIMAPATFKSIRNRLQMSRHLARFILISYGIGLISITPNLLRQAGIPEAVCNSVFMNIFLFHNVFDSIHSGGMLKGEIAILLAFSLQYAALLIALRKS